MSGKVGSRIMVRFDAVDEHVRSPIITCRVVERLGFNHDAGARMAIVEHDGKQIMVVHTLGPRAAFVYVVSGIDDV